MSQYDKILSKLGNLSSWSSQNETALLEPFSYITSNPGKEIRGQLIDAFNVWLEVPTPKLAVISRLVNMLHSASLLWIYGIPQTINTANYVFFLAYQELFALREDSSESGLGERASKLDAIVTEELLSLHRGQGLELLWRDSLQCPTEEEYISMVNNSFAEDLTEGKFSFPVVHGIHADTTNRQVLNVLQKRPTTPTLKIHTISYLRNHTNSFEYTHTVLGTLEVQMREEIKRLGGNSKLEKIVDYLSVEKAKEGKEGQTS
ncbi:hypothetical protein H0H87_002280 [Tephrocybe sp. NHM501043]|nr:hypothetical protein H0H87_002280 [Tephrocybe sp. NHM501043]